MTTITFSLSNEELLEKKGSNKQFNVFFTNPDNIIYGSTNKFTIADTYSDNINYVQLRFNNSFFGTSLIYIFVKYIENSGEMRSSTDMSTTHLKFDVPVQLGNIAEMKFTLNLIPEQPQTNYAYKISSIQINDKTYTYDDTSYTYKGGKSKRKTKKHSSKHRKQRKSSKNTKNK